MKPKPPVIVVDLFPEERRALLDLLSGLPAERWGASTICAGWTVKDLAAHLIGDDFNNLSSGRDRYAASWFAGPPSWDALVQYINQRNEEWVQALRRLSPRVVIELVEFSSERTIACYRTLDPMAPGPEVSWAGPGAAPMWLHIAREYTERWMHQQQIRDGAGAPPLNTARLFGPVLDTFVHALPHTYRNVDAPDGTHVQLVITGPAWEALRQDVAHPHRNVREGTRRQHSVFVVKGDLLILAVLRVVHDLDLAAVDIHDPVLGHAGSGVQRRLRVTVITQGRISNLDHQQRIGSNGDTATVAIERWQEQRHVRLRLAVVRQANRVLGMNHRAGTQLRVERGGECIYRPRVIRTDRRHIDHLSPDQLDPVVLVQDARLSHPVIIVEGEPMAGHCRLCRGHEK